MLLPGLMTIHVKEEEVVVVLMIYKNDSYKVAVHSQPFRSFNFRQLTRALLFDSTRIYSGFAAPNLMVGVIQEAVNEAWFSRHLKASK